MSPPERVQRVGHRRLIDLVQVMGRRRWWWAAGGSLLLHAMFGALLWRQPMPESLPTSPQHAPVAHVRALQWVAVDPDPVAARRVNADSAAPTASTLQAAQSRAEVRAGLRASDARSAAAAFPASSSRTPDPEPAGSSEAVAAVAPQPAASHALPSLSLDSVGQALQRERRWQRQHGPQQLAGAWRAASPEARGDGMTEHHRYGPDGARVAQISGSAGTFCVEIPSANTPSAMGAAPRLAPTRNCR